MREKCREIEHEDSAKSLKKYLDDPGSILVVCREECSNPLGASNPLFFETKCGA
jgi:hypothetical protein